MLRVYNVSGQIVMTDTKKGAAIKLLPGKTIDLEAHAEIGNKMSEQLSKGLLKIKEVPVGVPAPTSHPEPKKKPSKKDIKAAKAKFQREHSMTGGAIPEPGVKAAEKPIPAEPADEPAAEKPKKGIKERVKDAVGLGKKDDEPKVGSDDYLKGLAASDLSNDDFIKAIMQYMIDTGDNLGKDDKPNQPVLEAKVMELRPKIQHVNADRRDRLFGELPKEADSG